MTTLTNTILSIIDRLTTQVSPLNSVIEKLVVRVVPQTTARADCCSSFDCGLTQCHCYGSGCCQDLMFFNWCGGYCDILCAICWNPC